MALFVSIINFVLFKYRKITCLTHETDIDLDRISSYLRMKIFIQNLTHQNLLFLRKLSSEYLYIFQNCINFCLLYKLTC